MQLQILVVAFALIATVVSQNTVEVGYCKVVGTSNDQGVTGYIEFLMSGNLVQMNVNVSGITVNPDIPHGIHIHQYGDISSADASITGTHWNPTNAPHGCPDSSAARHYGDTGNWTAAAGSIVETKTLDLISLTGTYSIIGFAVIIHSTTDDCAVTTSAGIRIAQCVIGIANPANYNATINNALAMTTRPYGNATRGSCVLASTAGNTAVGNVFFEPQLNGIIRVRAILSNLVADSLHGFHIHQWGDLRTANAVGTGGHWNPTNSNHGIPPYPVRHIGDMGNIHYYNGSVAYYEYSFSIFGLNEATYNVIGRAVILHAVFDDCGQPLGNAGARLAQCVIGYANPATNYTWDSSVDVSQNESRCYASTTGAEITTGVAAPVTTGVAASVTTGVAASVTTGRVAVATTGVAPVTTTASATGGADSDSGAAVEAFCAILAVVSLAFAL